MKFLIENVKCQNCANLIKNSLSEKFGDIKIDVDNKTIELFIDENMINELKIELDDLGFELKDRI